MANEFGINWMPSAFSSVVSKNSDNIGTVSSQENRLLNQLAVEMRAAQSLPELLESAIAPLRQFLELDRVNFYRLIPDGQLAVVAESIRDNALPALQGTHLSSQHIPPIHRDLFSRECHRLIIDLNAGKTTVYLHPGNNKDNITHQPNHPAYTLVLADMGVVTYLLVPIFHQQALWGFLAGHHRQTKRFSHKQLHTLQIVLDQISIGIAQADLLSRAQLQTQQDNLIRQISNLGQCPASNSANTQKLLMTLAQSLQADGARLYAIAEPIHHIPQVHTFGTQPDTPIHVEKNALWQRVMYEGHPDKREQVYPIDNIYEQSILEPLYFALQQTNIRSLLIIPLRYSQQCIGCITLFRLAAATPGWSTAEVQLAEALAVHLYTAVMQQRVEQMFRHQSYYDLLTGLPNRLLIQQRLTLALAEVQERGELLAVLFLDLDRFKTINDSLGHETGDRLLQMVTTRLQQAAAVYDVLGRWSGDEFTFLVSSFTNMAELAGIAEIILATLTPPFEFEDTFPHLGSNTIYVQASIGIAISPYDGEDGETLVKNATAALDRAKRRGRNYYEICNSAISTQAVDRLRLENVLYRATDSLRIEAIAADLTWGEEDTGSLFAQRPHGFESRQQFILHYQPQVDLHSHRVIGAEALIRCFDAQERFISPADFIPVAEETGLINQIGEWVLNTACQQNKLWQTQGVGFFPVAVNLSVKQIQQSNFVQIVLMALERSGLAPAYLEVEITESIAIQELQRTIEVLQQLRSYGIQVSLDDFGTGYSSLAALKHLPLDQLKVDRSFIKELTADSIDAGIVRTIVNLGHELKLHVIAEGVETVEQLAFLQTVGCDGAQGFFFSKPLLAGDFVAKIESLQNHPPAGWVCRQPPSVPTEGVSGRDGCRIDLGNG